MKSVYLHRPVAILPLLLLPLLTTCGTAGGVDAAYAAVAELHMPDGGGAWHKIGE